MNRIRLFVIGMALAFALPAIAQQSEPAQQLPSLDQHLKALSQKLDLTSDQQDKARPILKEMQDAMQKVMDEKSLTPEQMHEQMRPAHEKADKELRKILTEEQKKKLDELESQSHPGLHEQQ